MYHNISWIYYRKIVELQRKSQSKHREWFPTDTSNFSTVTLKPNEAKL